MITEGTKGTYNGMAVAVTKVHDDGTLDLQKVWEDGTSENLPWFERILPERFAPAEEPAPDGEGVTLENVHIETNTGADVDDGATRQAAGGTYGTDGSTDTPEDEIPPAGV